jgi:hypothetical protein
MCTGAVLYRNTPAAAHFLEHWWRLALTGCCWRGPLHDQVAFKHMLQVCLITATLLLGALLFMYKCYLLLSVALVAAEWMLLAGTSSQPGLQTHAAGDGNKSRSLAPDI